MTVVYIILGGEHQPVSGVMTFHPRFEKKRDERVKVVKEKAKTPSPRPRPCSRCGNKSLEKLKADKILLDKRLQVITNHT